MNWLVIVFFVILAGNVYQGYRKGFLRVALSLVSWIVVVLVANALAPQLTEVWIARTDIDKTITASINETIAQAVEQVDIEQRLPPVIKDMLLENGISLTEIVGQDVVHAEMLMPYIFGALRIVCTVFLFLLMRIALFVIDHILAFASRLPIIGQADKALGVLLGFLKGMVVVWILMTVLVFVAMIDTDFSIITRIYESKLLTWFYENNVILNFIMHV